jgi:predicted HTH domain antitoxin
MRVDTKSIQIDYPADLQVGMTPDQLERLAREAFYVRLYERGKVSSSQAGALLGISRSDFLDLLGTYGLSYFDDSADLADDRRNAEDARVRDQRD